MSVFDKLQEAAELVTVSGHSGAKYDVDWGIGLHRRIWAK